MKHEISGTVSRVFIAPDPKSLVSQAREQIELTFDGVTGDRHWGATKASGGRESSYPRGTIIRNYRQVSILSVEELAEIAQRLGVPAVQAEWLGANLLFSGIPQLSFLPPSTRLVFPQGTVLVVDGENFPCSSTARVVQSQYANIPGLEATFPKQAMHLRGLVGWVEHPGIICPGETVRALIPEQRIYSLP